MGFCGESGELKELSTSARQWNDRLFDVVQVHVFGYLSTLISAHPGRSLSENISELRRNKNIKPLEELENDLSLAQLSLSENHEWGSHEILGRIIFDDTSGTLKCGPA